MKTIINQLLAREIRMDEIKKYESLVRYYRNNDFSTSCSQIQEVKVHNSFIVVLVKDCWGGYGETTYTSNLFILVGGGMLHASKKVFFGGDWRAPKEWSIASILETNDVFIVEGKPFGKEVLKKSEKFFPRCPLKEEWEKFFRKGGD